MLDWAPLEGPGQPVKFGWAVLAGAGWLVTFGWAVLPGPGLLVKLGGAVFPVPDNIGWDADFCGGIPEVRTWTWVDDWVDLRDIWELDEFELKSEKKERKYDLGDDSFPWYACILNNNNNKKTTEAKLNFQMPISF